MRFEPSFNVWSRKKLQEKLEYMHANPLQREPAWAGKLVVHPRDSPWSRWANYAKGEGWIGVDSVD